MKHAALGLAAALVLFLLVSLWLGVVPNEDQYVTLDYARHLAAGDGFVINSGDTPTEGFTGLLWTLLCAPLYVLQLDVPAIAPYLSLLFGALALTLLWGLLRRRSHTTADWLVPLAVAACAGPFIAASMSGTDTTLFAALLIAGALALDRALNRAGALDVSLLVATMFLTVVCRFEGLIPAVVVAVVLLRAGNDRRLRVAALAIIALSVFFHGWRVVTFGQLIPDVVRVYAGFNTALLERTQPYDIEPFGVYYAILGTLALAAWKSGGRGTTERYALLTAAVLALYYLFLQDTVPAQFRSSVLVGLSIVTWPALVARVRGLFDGGPSQRLVPSILVAAVLIIALGLVADLRISTVRATESVRTAGRPFGEWIQRWFPGIRVATDQPGAFTYYSGARIIDLRPGSRIGNPYSGYNEMLNAERPQCVVVDAEGVFDSEPMPAIESLIPLLSKRYRILGALRTDWTRDRSFLIFLRNDIPHITEEARDAFPPGIGAILRLNR